MDACIFICLFFLSKTSGRKLLQNASLKCQLASPICCTIVLLFFLFPLHFFCDSASSFLLTGCCEKHHTSYCFHQCNYISCVYVGNLEACIRMQQNSKQLSYVCGILLDFALFWNFILSLCGGRLFIINHITITNRLNLFLSFFAMKNNFFFNV